MQTLGGKKNSSFNLASTNLTSVLDFQNQCITMEPSWLLLISFFIPLQAFPTILLSFFLTY